MPQAPPAVHETDTIAAVATPPGHGGIGVVRVSGARAEHIAEAILGTVPVPRRAHFVAFRDAAGSAIDRGIALYFRAPHSFTGEDVLELQGHGGPVVMDRLLVRCAEMGARLARPGEFSERAFLNDKLDLAQAEAIADLIEADTGEAASAAMRSLDGEFSRRVHALARDMVGLRVYVEAAIDFADEEIDFLGEGEVLARLAGIEDRLAALRASAAQGAVLREGLRVVIAGAPNVGKSSLLNSLAGRDTAIVTDIPGTTRDVLAEHIVLDGLPLHVIDTAGLRESVDPVEVEGVRRARGEIERADRLLLVVDDRAGIGGEERGMLAALPQPLPVSVIRNKCDLSGDPAGRVADADRETVRVSATSGAGLDDLVAHLKDCAGYRRTEAGGFLARRRHLDALDRAATALATGHRHLERDAAGELLAEELRLAHRALGEITGEFTSEDLLGEIFASFCIGK